MWPPSLNQVADFPKSIYDFNWETLLDDKVLKDLDERLSLVDGDWEPDEGAPSASANGSAGTDDAAVCAAVLSKPPSEVFNLYDVIPGLAQSHPPRHSTGAGLPYGTMAWPGLHGGEGGGGETEKDGGSEGGGGGGSSAGISSIRVGSEFQAYVPAWGGAIADASGPKLPELVSAIYSSGEAMRSEQEELVASKDILSDLDYDDASDFDGNVSVLRTSRQEDLLTVASTASAAVSKVGGAVASKDNEAGHDSLSDHDYDDDEASSRAQKRAKPAEAVVAAAYRSLTPPNDGSVLVGRTVTKSFPPDGTCEGTIKSFDEAESLWRVVYEDGDEEEIKFDELVVILNEPYTEAAIVAPEKGSEDGVASTKDTDIAEEASVGSDFEEDACVSRTSTAASPLRSLHPPGKTTVPIWKSRGPATSKYRGVQDSASGPPDVSLSSGGGKGQRTLVAAAPSPVKGIREPAVELSNILGCALTECEQLLKRANYSQERACELYFGESSGAAPHLNTAIAAAVQTAVAPHLDGKGAGSTAPVEVGNAAVKRFAAETPQVTTQQQQRRAADFPGVKLAGAGARAAATASSSDDEDSLLDESWKLPCRESPLLRKVYYF